MDVSASVEEEDAADETIDDEAVEAVVVWRSGRLCPAPAPAAIAAVDDDAAASVADAVVAAAASDDDV